MSAESLTKQVGALVLVGPDRGWIRYVGPLQHVAKDGPETEQVWVGVEWEAEGRGKHDGIVKGHRYFQTKPLSAGLLKPGKVVTGGSFCDGVKSRYEETHEGKFMFLNPKMYLQNISLSGQPLGPDSAALLERIDDIIVGLGSVKHLDVSKTLIREWLAVFELAGHMATTLEELIVSRNYFTAALCQLDIAPCQQLCRLTTLVANGTGLCSGPKWLEQLSLLDRHMPCLREIHLMQNGITLEQDAAEGSESSASELLSGLEHLNLDSNRISRWETVWDAFSRIPRLGTLQLASNHLETLTTRIDPTEQRFSALHTLTLSNNHLAQWRDLNTLNFFASLERLKIGGNPFWENEGSSRARMLTVARVGPIINLNNVIVRCSTTKQIGRHRPEHLGRERANNEVAYLEEVARAIHESNPSFPSEEDAIPEDVLAEHPRLPDLIDLHGLPTIGAVRPKEKKKAELTFVPVGASVKDHETLRKTIPLAISVGRLYLLVSKLYHEPNLVLYYRPSKDTPQRDLLDRNAQDLAFFGMSDGGIVEIDDPPGAPWPLGQGGSAKTQ